MNINELLVQVKQTLEDASYVIRYNEVLECTELNNQVLDSIGLEAIRKLLEANGLIGAPAINCLHEIADENSYNPSDGITDCLKQLINETCYEQILEHYLYDGLRKLGKNLVGTNGNIKPFVKDFITDEMEKLGYWYKEEKDMNGIPFMVYEKQG